MKIHYLPIVAALLCLAGASLPERELPRKGKDFALFIAVNNYQNWDKLKHPISEVEKIAGELYKQYDFDTLVLRNPSQDQIVATLRQYNAKKYPDDGQLLIYLSGHGEFDDLTKEGFFIPREGRRNDLAQTSYLSFSRLQKIVENMPCRHIILAIDACYSGTFDRLVALKGDKEPTFGRPFSIADERNRVIERELTLQSRFFVASGKKEQTPDASNFAAYFLRALRNGGRDYDLLSMHELVAELKKAQPKPHVSTFSGHQEDANFVFVKNLSSIPGPAIHDARRDLADWQEAERLNTAAAYRAYLNKQPRGEFRALAETRANALEVEEREINAWDTAKKLDNCAGYKKFINDFPNSPYRPLAETAEKRTCKSASTLPAPLQKLEADMITVVGGSFAMGCKSGRDTDCDDNEKPPHKVRVGNFAIGRYEVTQAQWRAVMSSNPSTFGNCEECPVEQVFWNDIQDFLQKLNTLTGKRYRLPTEAEWEYAARGGNQSRGYLYSGSNTIDEVAWYDSNSGRKTHPVGGKKANKLGLYDMSGNVHEWCEDDWHSNYNGAPVGGSAWVDSPRGSYRVVRGGSCFRTAPLCSVAFRGYSTPAPLFGNIGFRLAL